MAKYIKNIKNIFNNNNQKKEYIPIGLDNINLNCYMNSVIQCLFYLKKFREYFLKKNFSEEEQPLSCELKDIFKKLKNRNNGKSFNLEKLKNLMGELDDSFLGSNGADASDLLNYIISSLSAEQTNYLGPDISMMTELDTTDKFKVYNDCKESVGDDTALIYIMNYLNTKYECFNLKKVNKKREYHPAFYSFEKKGIIEFNLDIITKANFEIKNCFKYCFNQKTQSEEFCRDCNKYVQCDCKTNIYKISDYLIIALNYKKNNNKNIKIGYDEYINLQNFVEDFTERGNSHVFSPNYCYRLVGIVFHLGDSSSYGHYFSVCRITNDENNINNKEKIYLFNDRNVKPLESFKQISYSPYILFYEKYYDNNIKNKFNVYSN